MEDYVKAFIKVGLTIVDMNEPRASDEQTKISVAMAWLQKIPLYLYWELKKERSIIMVNELDKFLFIY